MLELLTVLYIIQYFSVNVLTRFSAVTRTYCRRY